MDKAADIVFGIHAVTSALRLKPEQVRELWVDKARVDERMLLLLETAQARHILVHQVNRARLDELVGNNKHQGVAANCISGYWLRDHQLTSLLDDLKPPGFFLVLDGVTDPHNLGACLRSANGAGVDGVIIPKDRSVGLTPVVRKVASGAADATAVFQVTNLARTLRELKDKGIWIYGLAGDATQTLYNTDFSGPVALVLGAEGKGIRRLTREHCDQLVQIPMAGPVESLNVSVATGICLYEVVRQRHLAVEKESAKST